MIGLTQDVPNFYKSSALYKTRIESQLKIISPSEALLRIINKEKKPGDLVLALIFCDWQELDQFEALKNVDLAINGFHYMPRTQLQMIEKTPVISAGYRGRFFQHTSILPTKTGFRFDKIQEVFVPTEFAQNPELTGIIDDYLAETRRLYGGKTPIQNPVQITNKNTPNDPKLKKNRYIGAELCKDCHQKEYESWKKTPHSNAIQTLKKIKREYDPDCVQCHVTGFANGGYTNLELTPHLANVQCEVCHGEGYLHTQEQQRIQLYKITGKKLKDTKIVHQMKNIFNENFCTKCHDEDNDLNFNFAEDILKVSHN